MSSFDDGPVLYRPEGATVGDAIPIEVGGELRLFYLYETRESMDGASHDGAAGMSWALVATRDLVHFEDRGVVYPHGDRDQQDFNVYTGSVVVDGATAHLFSTGFNPWLVDGDGVAPQVVMHATSTDDMRTWQRHPEQTFGAVAGYERADWRDPFVFRPDPSGPWRMLLAARSTTGPWRRRGVVAQLVSDDLAAWRVVAPFWEPRRYITQECPDVFRWGDWWYLVYSEYSESNATRYRMARDVDGPWSVPDHDTVDGRAFYAVKTVARDGRRFLAGWIATKEGDADDGPWQWGGTLSVLEATQRADGTLAFRLPQELIDSFDVEVPAGPSAPVSIAVPDAFDAAVGDEPLPERFLARLEVDIADGTREVVVLLRSSADGDEAYAVRLEPHRSRMVLDRWPRRASPTAWSRSWGEGAHALELERPCALSPGRHTLDLLVDGSAVVIVLDHAVAMSGRLYDRTGGHLGVAVGEGAATFERIRVLRRGLSAGSAVPR